MFEQLPEWLEHLILKCKFIAIPMVYTFLIKFYLESSSVSIHKGQESRTYECI